MGCGHSQLENQYQTQAKQIQKRFADEELKTQFINLFEVFDDSQQQKCMYQIQNYFKNFQRENYKNYQHEKMDIFETDFYHFTDIIQNQKNDFSAKQAYDFDCKFTSEFQALFFLNLQKDKLNEFDSSYNDYKLIKYNIDFNQIILVESYQRQVAEKWNEVVQLRYIKKLGEQNYEEFSIDINKTNLINLPFFSHYKNDDLKDSTLANSTYKKYFKENSKMHRHFCYQKIQNKNELSQEQVQQDLNEQLMNYKSNIVKYMIEFLCSNYKNKDLIWFTYNQSSIEKIFEENIKILKNEINVQEYQLTETNRQIFQQLHTIFQTKNPNQIESLLLQTNGLIKNRIQQTKITLNDLDEELDISEQQDSYELEEQTQNKSPDKNNNLSTRINSENIGSPKIIQNTHELQQMKDNNELQIKQEDSIEILNQKPRSEYNTNLNDNKLSKNILSKSMNVSYHKQTTQESIDLKNENKQANQLQKQKEKINPLFLKDSQNDSQKQASNVFVSRTETNMKKMDNQDDFVFRTRSDNKLNKLETEEQYRPRSEIQQRRSNLLELNNLIDQQNPLLKSEELQLINKIYSKINFKSIQQISRNFFQYNIFL